MAKMQRSERSVWCEPVASGRPDVGNPTSENTDHHRPVSLGVALAATSKDGPGVIALVPGRGSLLLFSYKTH